MEAATRSRLTFGVMPILLRLVLFGMQYIRDVGDSVVLIASGLLLVAGYLYTRASLLLVVWCILFGLGFGSSESGTSTSAAGSPTTGWVSASSWSTWSRCCISAAPTAGR